MPRSAKQDSDDDDGGGDDNDVYDGDGDDDGGSLDYTLTFPSARRGFSRDPVVLMFGWSGALDRSMVKYSTIYEHDGCITIRYIAPFDDCVEKKGSYDAIGWRLFELLDEMELRAHPMILHVFGRNGSLVLNGFLSALQSAKRPCDDIAYNLKGVVFDSAPAPVSSYQRAQAWAFYECPPSQYEQNSWTVLFWLTVYLIISLCHSWYLCLLALYDHSTMVKRVPYYELGKLVHLPVKQLYLYSRSDPVCPYTSVEAFMDRQRRDRFADIDSVLWDQSPHCDHLRYHPEEYRRKMKEFLRYTLKQVIDEQREESEDELDMRRGSNLSTGTFQVGFKDRNQISFEGQ